MTASLSPGWILAGRGWGQTGGRRLGEELREGERVGSGRGTEARGGAEGGLRQGDGGLGRS